MSIDPLSLTLLTATIALVAFLYSSVGHAGASGYIAVMTLCGISAVTIRPVALILNILVACIGTAQFARAGHFSWKLFWPFALPSIPAAFIGGYLHIPVSILKILLGLVLLFSAARLFFRTSDPPKTTAPSTPLALSVGAGVGFLSGLTGTGGGIFLTPLVLLLRWAPIRGAAAISAPFILVNSSAGLAGVVTSHQPVSAFAWPLAAAAVTGGAVGSQLGSRHYAVRTISLLLATVLIIAGIKLLFT
jgi:uncharacterized membrane protein YfcA